MWTVVSARGLKPPWIQHLYITGLAFNGFKLYGGKDINDRQDVPESPSTNSVVHYSLICIYSHSWGEEIKTCINWGKPELGYHI
jgi:hypothetical protein